MASLTDPPVVSSGNNSFSDIRSSADLQNPFNEILSPSKQDPRLVISRNDQWYECKIYLQDFNSDENGTIADHRLRFNFGAAKLINPEIVLELVIEEDLLSWYNQGYMIVASNLEGFELNPTGESGGPALPPTHTFRADCRDMLLFSFIPVGNPDQQGNDFDNPFPIAEWMIRGEFAIYDVEDVQTENVALKAKKLYFRDIRYQLMSEQRIEFSTNQLHPIDPTGRVDNLVSTGEALSALLMRCNDPEYGFDWGDLMGISKDTWDEGASKIFFTAPANFAVLDSVNYILDRHVSKTGSSGSPTDFGGNVLQGIGSGSLDLCIFSTNRYSGEFELMPFSKLFELSTEGSQPGKYQIEHFFIPTITQEVKADQATPGIYRAPMMERNDWVRDTKLPNYGFIDHYQFVDMSGLDNVKAITNRPVFSYDFKEHQFYCEYKEHNITNIKDYFTNNYVKKLFGGSGGPYPLLTVNDIRKKIKNLEPVFSTKTSKESRCNDGRNQALYAAIYMNEHISFTTPGSTNRTDGRFIGIDKNPINTTENKFDWRLLGQWLVINVKHKITKDGYVNDIQAVKIHSYKDLKINEQIP